VATAENAILISDAAENIRKNATENRSGNAAEK